MGDRDPDRLGRPGAVRHRGWRLVPAHFAERHSLVIILALGESIIALGVGARVDLTAGVVTAAVLGIGLAAALWWTYFDVVALVNARRLVLATEGRERNMLARDSYSYLHFPMVAGIVLAHSASRRRSRTSTSHWTQSTRSRCSAGSRSTCSPM